MRKPSHINQLVLCKECPLAYCTTCQPTGCVCGATEYLTDHNDIRGEGKVFKDGSGSVIQGLRDTEPRLTINQNVIDNGMNTLRRNNTYVGAGIPLSVPPDMVMTSSSIYNSWEGIIGSVGDAV